MSNVECLLVVKRNAGISYLSYFIAYPGARMQIATLVKLSLTRTTSKLKTWGKTL